MKQKSATVPAMIEHESTTVTTQNPLNVADTTKLAGVEHIVFQVPTLPTKNSSPTVAIQLFLIEKRDRVLYLKHFGIIIVFISVIN